MLDVEFESTEDWNKVAYDLLRKEKNIYRHGLRVLISHLCLRVFILVRFGVQSRSELSHSDRIANSKKILLHILVTYPIWCCLSDQDQTDGQTEEGRRDEPDSSRTRTDTSGSSRNSKSALSEAAEHKDRDLILSTRKQDFQVEMVHNLLYIRNCGKGILSYNFTLFC